MDGKVKDIKNSYRNETYLVEYTGKKLEFNGEQPFAVVEEKAMDDSHIIRIKLATNNNANDVLQYLIPKTSINMLQEVIPDMNEIFIKTVNKAQ